MTLIALAIVVALQLLLARPLFAWMQRRSASPALALRLLLAFLLLAGVLWLGFWGLHLDLEQHDYLLWSYMAPLPALASFVLARRHGRMPTYELAYACFGVLSVAAAIVLAGPNASLSAAPVRTLLVAPAVLLLCSYFGGSLGFLASHAGDLRLNYEGFIGRRFLLSKASPALSTVTTISVVGVVLGVWLVIVALGVLAGFENDLTKKIIGANAHLVLQRDYGRPFVLTPTQEEQAHKVPGVVALSPVVQGEVAVSSQSNYTGALLFGIDPNAAQRVLTVLGQLERGNLSALEDEEGRPKAVANSPTAEAGDEAEDEPEFLPPAPLPHIVLGVEMAKGLNVGVGDTVRVISPMLEELTPLGPAPKTLAFKVAAIFASKMYEYDARYAFVSLASARRFLELKDDEITELQIATKDPDRADVVGKNLVGALGKSYTALDWKSRNQTLFSALKLERVVAFVVLVFIILVASFSIVNTLTMSVIEKKKEIAILKTMGARDGGVMKLFLVQGLIVGTVGTLIGAAAATLTVLLLERFGFSIPGEVYYIDSLPVHLSPVDVVLVVLAALLIVWDFSVFPALRGARLEPVEGLRDG